MSKQQTPIEKALSEYATARETAARDPGEYDWRSRPGIEVAIRLAKDSLPKLADEYCRTIMQNGAAIFTAGENGKVTEFAAAMSKEPSSIVVDAAELYDRLADPVDKALGTGDRQFSASYVGLMIAELKEIGEELGITSIQALDFKEMPLLPTRAAVVEYVRDVFRKAVGDDLNRAYVNKKITDRAFDIRYKGNTAVAVIHGALEEEVEGLSKSFGRGKTRVTIKPTDEINKEFLVSTYKNAMSKILNPTKNTQKNQGKE